MELALLQLFFSTLFLGSYFHSEVDGFFRRFKVGSAPKTNVFRLETEIRR